MLSGETKIITHLFQMVTDCLCMIFEVLLFELLWPWEKKGMQWYDTRSFSPLLDRVIPNTSIKLQSIQLSADKFVIGLKISSSFVLWCKLQTLNFAPLQIPATTGKKTKEAGIFFCGGSL